MATNKLGLVNLSPLKNDSPSLPVKKEDFMYTSHYCEENVWMMASKIKETFPEQLRYCYPVFISNDFCHIPLWRQSASKQEDGLVIWDYHVIMVYHNENETTVFDMDTTLPFPTPFDEYCRETFKSDEYLDSKFHRLFRVLTAESFLNNFSSDRSHMQKEDGSWVKPPPNYPAIKNTMEPHNLGQYISMKRDENVVRFGTVLNLNSFLDRFDRKPYRTLNIDYTYPPEPSVCNDFLV